MKTGILLVNLGTPDSPATADVRKYLREFLNDPRVIDIAPLARMLLVNLIIVPFRSPKSAALYKKIWTKNGSPLLYYSERQRDLLQQALGNDYTVELAMRYQTPSIEQALEKLKASGVNKIRVIPLFPQYASASTGSVHQKIMQLVSKWEVIPAIDFINSFCDDVHFIQSFAEVGRRYDHTQYDHVLMSFHGLPERQILKADNCNHCLKETCCDSLTANNTFCYRAQCFQTARMLAKALHLKPENYSVCFQSRLGKDPWIKPYSDHVIKQLGADGKKRLLVFAPAFVSDCLETLYEIAVEYDELFKEHGGEKIQMVESLNDSPQWIEALKKISTKSIQERDMNLQNQ